MERMRNAIIAIACVVSLSGLTVLPSRDVALSQPNRARIENLACRKPFKVRAKEIRGWRLEAETRPSVHASVNCEPHLVTDRYDAHYHVDCWKKRTTWECESPVLKLRTHFVGAGPYEIIVSGLEPEEAMSSLSCLEAALRQRPDLVGAEMKAEPSLLIARNTHGIATISAGVSSPVKQCLSVSFARACDANAPVPLEVESDECLEE